MEVLPVCAGALDVCEVVDVIELVRFARWRSRIPMILILRIVVTYSHQWMIFLLVFIAYLTWANGVGAWIPSMPSYWNSVLQLIHEDEGGWSAYVADPNWDPLGFGQVSLPRSLCLIVISYPACLAPRCDRCPSTSV